MQVHDRIKTPNCDFIIRNASGKTCTIAVTNVIVVQPGTCKVTVNFVPAKQLPTEFILCYYLF